MPNPNLLVRDQQISSTPKALIWHWQHYCTLRQIVDVVHTKKRQSAIALRMILIPVLLALLPLAELHPLSLCPWIAPQYNIAREPHNSLGEK